MKGGPNPHFSLNDEARNTERHHSWNSDLKLRHSRISFVSAGTSKAEELTRAPQEKLTEDGGRPNNAPFDAVEGLDEVSTREQIAPNIPDDSMMNMSLSEIPDRSLQTQDNKMEILHDGNEPHRDTIVQESFFNDSQGSNKVFHTGFPPPKVRRSPSVADTDSSEEVILFPGRKALPSARRPNSNVQQSVHKVQAVSSRGSSNDPTFVAKSFPSIIDDSVISNSEVNSSIESKPQDRHFTLNNVGNHESSNTSGRDIPSPASTKHRKRGRGRRPKRSDDEAAILADYIANISDSAGPEGRPDSSILNRRDLGDADNDQWQDSEESIMIEERTQDLGKGADGWDSDDLQDFEELSTSSEALDAVKEILSKRERPSGVQYLVVGEGLTIDDARWLPLESFDQAGVRDKIKVFEDERAEFERQFACCELPDDSSIEDEELTMNLQEQSEDLEDERDLEERRIERMTDEQIARLLSKQEELGLGSNSLMLFDGEDLADDMTQETQLDGCWSSPVLRQSRPKPKPINREQTSFPSATAFADVLEQDPYNGFDVMDQERPSLRKIPKGRRGKMALELSDSELEQSMFLAWENDRSKKKKRKQDREELRAQGLLGKKDKIDLKAKYSEGMSMNQVKNEVRDFLLSSKERYSNLIFTHGSIGLTVVAYNCRQWLSTNVKSSMR